MKIFKKIVALTAMAAVCFTMSAPVTASAAMAECPPHLYDTTNHRYDVVDSESHSITYFEDINGDGIEEEITETCVIEWTDYLYDLVCLKCGSASYNLSNGVYDLHRNSNCEYYPVG